MMDISKFAAELSAKGEPLVIAGPVSDSQISDVETTLAAKISGQYRRFLRRYGTIAVLDAPVNGIYPDDHMSEAGGTLLGDTLRVREEFGLDRELLVIRVSEDEHFVCLDQGSENVEGAVYAVEVRKGHTRTKLADSFEDYVKGDLEAAIDAIQE